MKKLVVLMIGLILVSISVMAGNDKPVTMQQLPRKAQTFVKEYFANHTVALSKMDNDFIHKTYDVIFTNGDKVEFDRRGNWTDVDCGYTEVPIDIVPAPIRTYVSKNYPDATIKKLEKDGSGYEIKLSNGLEVKFNRSFNVVDLDD